MLPESLQNLIDSFTKLPGVGRKTAERFAYFLMRSEHSLAREIGETLLHVQDRLMLCRECFLLSDNELCVICMNPRRDSHLICVVETIFDAEAIERSGEFRGRYHILHGRIAPLDNITPEDLKIRELILRVERVLDSPSNASPSDRSPSSSAPLEILPNGQPLEIILATNPSSEGETTALYLQRLLKPLGVKITRIATGIPVGSDVEYADEITLGRAMKGRHQYEE